MLNQTYIWLRLLTCLFVSTALHAGTTVLEWTAGEAPTLSGTRQLEVALVPLPEAPADSRVRAEESPPAEVFSEDRNVTVGSRPQASMVTAGGTNNPAVPTPKPRGRRPAEIRPRPVTAEKAARFDASRLVDAADRSTASPREVSGAHPRQEFSSAPLGQSAPAAETAALQPAEDRQGPPPVSAKVPDLHRRAEPIYRSNPLPEYPLQARRRHWEGAVWLRVSVSAQGMVTGLRVEESSGYPILDRAAQASVRRWQFRPARRDGRPVACEVRIPVNFQLEEG